MNGLTPRWHAGELAVGLLASKVTDLPQATLPESAPIRGESSTSAGRAVIFAHSHAETVGPDVRVKAPFRALTNAKIGIFALSTFDTDRILVPVASTGSATRALTAAGHPVPDADNGTSRASVSAEESHPGAGEASGVPQATEEP
jgi:hypothetical protein